MSYSFVSPCSYCERADHERDVKCEDESKVREAISKIHMSTDGTHQGSGNIILTCFKCVSTLK